MNYGVLRSKISQTAKLVWHLIKDGIHWPKTICEELEMGRTQTHHALGELEKAGYILRVEMGFYRICEVEPSVRKAEHIVRETEQSVRKTEQSKDDCSENRTLETPLFGKPNTSDRSENRTESSGNRTDRSESRTDCPENRTPPPRHKKVLT